MINKPYALKIPIPNHFKKPIISYRYKRYQSYYTKCIPNYTYPTDP